MPLEIDSATDDLSEDLGKLIQATGQEDASGARRMLNHYFANRAWPSIARMLKTDEAEALRLGDVLFAKYGMPEDERAPQALKAAVEPPMCPICGRFTAPYGGHEGEEVCDGPGNNCLGIQPYGLSNYPGEFKLVKAHPLNYGRDNEGEQYYKRCDVDPLLRELKRLQNFGSSPDTIADAVFGAISDRVDKYVNDPAYPAPTPEDLASPLFEAVWQAIKGWDLSRYGSGGPGPTLYSGASGDDVMHILKAVEPLLLKIMADTQVDAFCSEEVPDGLGGKEARFKFPQAAHAALEAISMVLNCAIELLEAERIKASIFHKALTDLGAPLKDARPDKLYAWCAAQRRRAEVLEQVITRLNAPLNPDWLDENALLRWADELNLNAHGAP